MMKAHAQTGVEPILSLSDNDGVDEGMPLKQTHFEYWKDQEQNYIKQIAQERKSIFRKLKSLNSQDIIEQIQEEFLLQQEEKLTQ